jgi:putative membrane protein insertion efficiency factor
MTRLLVWLLRAYKLLVSPMLGQNCRFYAIEALQVHGAARGGWLAARRVCRCHPWNAGGVDLVPGAPVPDADMHASHSSSTVCVRKHS